MKFLCTLAEQKYYQPMQSTTPGKYIWVDKATSLLRVTAPIPDPWGQQMVILLSIDKAKNDDFQYPNRLFLKCFPVDSSNSNTQSGKLIREVMWGKFAYSQNSPALFFCFPHQDNEKTINQLRGQLWLIYSFYDQ